MDESMFVRGVEPRRPATASLPAASVAGGSGDSMVMQVLSTEHMSLLSQRSLVYNEAFTRVGMLLTFVSMSLVALALLSGALPVRSDLVAIVAIVIGFDLVVGVATVIRVRNAYQEDFIAVQAMNRVRRGYLDLAPGAAPYLSMGTDDDLPSVTRLLRGVDRRHPPRLPASRTACPRRSGWRCSSSPCLPEHSSRSSGWRPVRAVGPRLLPERSAVSSPWPSWAGSAIGHRSAARQASSSASQHRLRKDRTPRSDDAPPAQHPRPGQVEPVLPLEHVGEADRRRIRLYSCGPTVYRWAHVGNLRTFLLADFIRRALLYHGLDVFHVQNITDVGHLRDERFDRGADRMLVAAKLENKTTAEIADAYEAGFHADAALVNLLPAHVFPRATEHIPEMLALAASLEDLGYAYLAPDGTLYYEVARLADYGRLSGNTLDELRAGHRVDVEAGKRDAADFALWKAAGEGRELKWPSKWGEGFPGWHLECSAMARRYLGDEFEIHTGGVDNVFPHHEDEIAQSVPVTGKVPARHWVHGEHLLMSGRKMAKSAGNFQRITELVEEGIDPLAFRYLTLTSHYRRKLNYSDASITAAARSLDSLRARLRALGPPPDPGHGRRRRSCEREPPGDRPEGIAESVEGHGGDGSYIVRDRAHEPEAPLSDAGRALHDRFVAALDDDLDLPVALAVVRETLRADLPADERRWLVLDADAVLGLDLDRVWEAPSSRGSGRDVGSRMLPDGAAALIAERSAARAARDFARADALAR